MSRAKRESGDVSDPARIAGAPRPLPASKRATVRTAKLQRPPSSPHPPLLPQTSRDHIALPAISYPAELPVFAHREEIAAAISAHQVVIIAGATGSGKTTQIPKIVLELGRGRAGLIGHTQPRRIAARAVAERLSTELGTQLGSTVGYQVRFTDVTSDDTFIKVMTDGILLAQIARDPQLRSYDTIIIDEAHERSLNIDFILGYLTRLLPQRPDLKLIITSATIDSQRFAAHFAAATGAPVPVISVSGRTYPVEIRYRPLTLELPGRPAIERDQNTAICQAVDELCAIGPGDILVFLSGEREIRDAADALTGHFARGCMAVGGRPAAGKAAGRKMQETSNVEILPLYGRLSSAEQHRIFAPHVTRRVVLATNVAETSLTVPGIHYVIDTGTARISRYSKATKVQRLPIEPISQASADQRAGRCGRVANGIAIRLYSSEDFQGRPQFTEPEILRTSLAFVILHMVAAGVAATADDISSFPFVDPPDVRAIRDGLLQLTELGAINTRSAPAVGTPTDTVNPHPTAPAPRTTAAIPANHAKAKPAQARAMELTSVGRTMASLSLDPRLARMIVSAGEATAQIIIIAAALSIQDVRERPSETRATADALHARFLDPTSDFLTYLNLWQYLRLQAKELSTSAFRRKLRAENLNYLRVREWQDLVTQIRQQAKSVGLSPAAGHQPERLTVTTSELVRKAAAGAEAYRSETTDTLAFRFAWDSEPIHRAILPGLLAGVGVRLEPEAVPGTKTHRGKRQRRTLTEYAGARGSRFAIFPASGLAKQPPDVVMAAELVETSRLWARDVARVEAKWVEEAGAHLLKRSYVEPRWSKRLGAAVVTEKVSLLGVPLVPGRQVLLGRIDGESARELFIRHALVAGEWRTHQRFWHANQEVLAAAAELQARARRNDLVWDDEALFAFYDERVPATVVGARHFDNWLRRTKGAADSLHLTLAMVQLDGGQGLDPSAYPSAWRQGDLELPLSYEFKPATASDGLIVHVDLAVLPRLQPAGFDWLTVGSRVELVTALIRTLPKPVRTPLVPAADMARRLVPLLAGAPEDTDTSPPLTEAIALAVRSLLGIVIDPAAFAPGRLAAHLRPTFRVSTPAGDSDGSDLLELQRRFAPEAHRQTSVVVRSALAAAKRQADSEHKKRAAQVASSGLASLDVGQLQHPDLAPRLGKPVQTWDFAIPKQIAAGKALVYPGLVWRDAAAQLDLFASANAREVAHADACQQLLAAQLALAPGRVTSRWDSRLALQLGVHPYASTAALVADLQVGAVGSLLAGKVPDCPAAYQDAYAKIRGLLEDEVYRLAQIVGGGLGPARQLQLRLDKVSSLALLNVGVELREWLQGLVFAGFVAAFDVKWLQQFPRYFAAANLRLDRALTHAAREATASWELQEVTSQFLTVRAGLRDPSRRQLAALAEVRWMLEELRVSLWAQGIGTTMPVSAKRITTALSAI